MIARTDRKVLLLNAFHIFVKVRRGTVAQNKSHIDSFIRQSYLPSNDWKCCYTIWIECLSREGLLIDSTIVDPLTASAPNQSLYTELHRRHTRP